MKCVIFCNYTFLAKVAPPVGAWIEMEVEALEAINMIVAPPVGAWIEIVRYRDNRYDSYRRSPRGSVD